MRRNCSKTVTVFVFAVRHSQQYDDVLITDAEIGCALDVNTDVYGMIGGDRSLCVCDKVKKTDVVGQKCCDGRLDERRVDCKVSQQHWDVLMLRRKKKNKDGGMESAEELRQFIRAAGRWRWFNAGGSLFASAGPLTAPSTCTFAFAFAFALPLA